MFVACTINVCDLKESQQSHDAGSRHRNEQINARLEFGLELLRQTGSTPSASRCALIIEQLLQTPARACDMEEGRPAEEASRGASSETGKPGIAIPTSPNKIQDSASLTRPDGIDVEWRQSLPSCPDGDILPTDTSRVPSQQTLPLLNAATATGIDTPYRWLPENVYDDGSWMLMDVDFSAWLQTE